MAEVAGSQQGKPREAPPNRVRIEFPSLPENVGFARAAAALFASQLAFTLDELDEIKLAVSEAVSNVVLHAYPREAPGRVELRLSREDGRVVIEVEDWGRGIDNVEQAQEPTFTTLPGERMGLGLTFIREYMEEVDIDSAPGRGTRLRMAKRVSQAAGLPSGAPPA